MTHEEFAIMTGKWVPEAGIPTLDDYSRALEEIHRDEAAEPSIPAVTYFIHDIDTALIRDAAESMKISVGAGIPRVLQLDYGGTTTAAITIHSHSASTESHHLVELDYSKFGDDHKPQ
jgi:hypothetical protein